MNLRAFAASAAVLCLASQGAYAALNAVTPTNSGVTFSMGTDGTNAIAFSEICGPSSYAALAPSQCQNGWVINSSGQALVLSTGALGISGGWTPKLLNALSTTVVSVKSSAGQLGMLYCYNPNSVQAYVQVFNVASGSVTLGTTSPTGGSYPIAPTSTGGLAMSSIGIQFSTAISVAATTTATGSTALTTAIDCNAAYN
jgi:hypothetical protein